MRRRYSLGRLNNTDVVLRNGEVMKVSEIVELLNALHHLMDIGIKRRQREAEDARRSADSN
jgi:uncharacterized protein YjiS (DUF1127 family)